MTLKSVAITAICFFAFLPSQAAQNEKSPEETALRDTMSNAFNRADSAAFFVAVKKLQDYLLEHDDLHGYYTQRCNEIVFQLNRQNIYEAYKLSIKLSHELRERKLERELYMPLNMMGHIYRYCGNEELARKCFHEVLNRMKAEGYEESMPPIYMNLVHLETDKNPEEALRLLEEAARVADSTGRKRNDIDTYRAIYAFRTGDMKAFYKGYQDYQKLLSQGLNSVHGPTLEAYYLLSQGDVEGAVNLIKERVGAEKGYATQAFIYEYAGDWENACRAIKLERAVTDSVNSVILSNSMQGIQHELELYEAERTAARLYIISLAVVVASLLILLAMLVVYSIKRRRHIKELKEARDQALESDRMKTAFIGNISHEIRTPLNIISGFTQVLSNSDTVLTEEERGNIAHMMMNNANLITSLVDELLDLSMTDSQVIPDRSDKVNCNELCREVIRANEYVKKAGVQMLLKSEIAESYELLTNRATLRKVLDAVVNNAAKNTEKGVICVMVRQEPSHMAFIVEDTGCGVPEGEAEHIFERFEKLDTFKTGLGLGLSLARTLMERLGGKIYLDTTYKGGARFVIEAPIP